MTVHEDLSKKLFRAKIAGLLSWIVFSVSMFIPLQIEVYIISLLSFIVFFVIVIYVMFLIKCPACQSPIGRVCMSGVTLFKSDIQLKRCPHCAYDFQSED